eukprot:35442-Chlamydomonas_euryale.AAC.4
MLPAMRSAAEAAGDVVLLQKLDGATHNPSEQLALLSADTAASAELDLKAQCAIEELEAAATADAERERRPRMRASHRGT